MLQPEKELRRGTRTKRASGHTATGGGRACAMKVGNPAGVEASIPSPSLFLIQGALCLLLYLIVPVYHIGPLTDIGDKK